MNISVEIFNPNKTFKRIFSDDVRKDVYKRQVPNYAPEKGKGHPPVMEAEAAAAMTCPGAIPLKTALCVPGRNDQPHIRV